MQVIGILNFAAKPVRFDAVNTEAAKFQTLALYIVKNFYMWFDHRFAHHCLPANLLV